MTLARQATSLLHELVHTNMDGVDGKTPCAWQVAGCRGQGSQFADAMPCYTVRCQSVSQDIPNNFVKSVSRSSWY